ncbi:MAG TPA: tetratricopeptide repeat protein [bacterium]|nr:tetratricopeptide repeat protein [bacterium]
MLRSRLPLLAVLGALVLAGCGDRVDPRVAEGYDLVVEGKVDEAIALANALLADDPEHKEARNLIGMALYKAGDAEGSVQQYQQAIDIDHTYPEAHFNLGNSYQVLGRIPEAEAEFLVAIEQQPKFVLAHYNLGVIYQRTGRDDQALAQFRRCVDYDPQFYPGFVGLGDILYKTGDFENAIANLERALELSPSQKQLRVVLGNALLQSGRPDAAKSAESEFRAAVGIDSTYVDGVYNLGVALAAQERTQEAAEQFRLARDLASGNPEKEGLVSQVERFLESLEAEGESAEEPSAG